MFLELTFIPFAKLLKVIVESLHQVYEVCTTCKLFVQSFTFVMTDYGHDFLHFPVKVFLN